jgi:transcriptional regulator with XRE-family HTH domain
MPLHGQRLPNYLRMHRKRAGFSQDEIALLLGTRSGAHVCRYERFSRQPTLATVFAFEVIFQVPASELFAGIHRKAQRQVAQRAATLVKQAVKGPARFPAAKLDALRSLAGTRAISAETQ